MDNRVTVNVSHTVELTHSHMLGIAERVLLSLVSPGEFLRNEKGKVLLKYDDPDHRHGSISEYTLREATEADIAVFHVLNMVREQSRKVDKDELGGCRRG